MNSVSALKPITDMVLKLLHMTKYLKIALKLFTITLENPLFFPDFVIYKHNETVLPSDRNYLCVSNPSTFCGLFLDFPNLTVAIHWSNCRKQFHILYFWLPSRYRGWWLQWLFSDAIFTKCMTNIYSVINQIVKCLKFF